VTLLVRTVNNAGQRLEESTGTVNQEDELW